MMKSDLESGSATSNMIRIPAGIFTMGDSRYERERPVREISTEEFWIDKYLVTNALLYEYAKYV